MSDIDARLATLKREVAALRPEGARPVVILPAKKLTPDMLPKACSGAETRAAMDRINSDRSAFYQHLRPDTQRTVARLRWPG